MNNSSISSAAAASLNFVTDDVITEAINVSEEFVEDFVDHNVTAFINFTYDAAQKLTNVTEESVVNLAEVIGDLGVCDFIISDVTSGNVTTTVTSYNPAVCGVCGSNPALKPLLIFILVCFTLWATFGNSCLVGVIATDKNMQEPGNTFLCALAFTDVAASFLYTPIAINSLVHGESHGGHWCRTQAFFVPFLATLSMYLQTSLWICRYIHIAHPMEFQSLLTPGRLAIAMVLCFLIALASPLVGLARVGRVLTYTVNMVPVDIAEPPSLMMPCALGGPEAAVSVVLCFLGVIISCCFAGLIYKEARKSQKKNNIKQAWLAQADKLENKLKAAKTLGIVVGVQWVTWIPGLILNMLGLFGCITVATSAFYGDIFFVIVHTSTFSDSIVYAFRNRIYRKALARLYRKMRNVMGDV